MKPPLWLQQLLLCFSYIHCFADKKCLEKEFIERHFYVDEYDLPLKIEVSNRISHQLVSNIAKILLTEAVGYSYVKLVQQDRDTVADNATRTMQKISTCSSHQKCDDVYFLGPEVMINLEVWLNPGFNMDEWLSTERIEDLGPLGPLGRSGWYIAEYTVKWFWESNNTIIDHWKAFTNPDVVKMFDLSQEDSVYNLSLSKKYCKYKACDSDGVYRFPECRKPNVQCATLLADYPASNLELLKREIEKHKLLVNIIWVGEKLEEIVEKRTATNKNTLFFHHMPSILSALGSFVRVSFPNCVEEKDSSCEFEISQLEKVVWSKIKSHAPHAFHVLRAIEFNQVQYLDMLKKYRDGLPRGIGVFDQACKWVNSHTHIWSLWMPGLDKTTLYIGGIFPLSGVYMRQASVVEAAEMAIKQINKNHTLLENYQFKLLQQNGQCAADEVMQSFINYVTNSTYKTMVGILGPACSDTVEPLAGIAKKFNTLIISYSAEGALFNHEKYPHFFRTIPENNHFTSVYLKLFEKLKYSRVAALTEDGQKYPEYISRLQDEMQNRKMSFIVNRKFPRERESLEMRPYLEDLKEKGAKIIIGDFYDYAARAVMCEAYKLGMTAAKGYVWFLPLWFSTNWFDTSKDSNQNSSSSSGLGQVDCTTREMWDAINGHLSLAYKFYADDHEIMQEKITVSAWLNNYVNESKEKGKEISHYGGYAYDAVWVYALALDALLKENNSNIATLHTPRTANRFVHFINETNFNGVSGPLNFSGSSRISDVIIWQWIDNVTHQVGVYHPSQIGGDLEFNETKIVWLTPNGEKPHDGSMNLNDCALAGLSQWLGITCDNATMLVYIIGSLGLAFVMIFGGGFILKKRYEEKIKRTEDRMKELGLNANNGPFALDEWEIPRDQIVINRKIGEGAFGAVFGGEAKTSDKVWIAVAVKTLKSGAKPEEKLDFLSEAEVMKQLDHMNIVKLVGVCTMGEPVYTVMEFMLYGDLKTYLLSRRSLIASEKDRASNDEVSDKRLTNMALDIARGLSYLADKKFVHRDLACRNCLVNISRSVKIADFGMCRPMFDSDYYRYNKKRNASCPMDVPRESN
nr:gamma-aminobutyric acid type B receptor subunit 1 isoform X2 [Parasteatoda tepidariorum]